MEKKITTIMFDLDGTLLPMNQDEFVNGYFKFLVKKLSAYGYDPNTLIPAIWTGTKAMVENDGTKLNEDVFWNKFEEILGERVIADKHLFEEFYANEFNNAQSICGYNEKSAKAVRLAKELGFKVVLATNPIFPRTATVSRTKWAGLDVDEFSYYTCYENSYYSKPNPKYFESICEHLSLSPDECLMVGNDVSEDLVAEKIGMDVFLIEDCMINKEEKDISGYNKGNFDDLMEYIKKLNK